AGTRVAQVDREPELALPEVAGEPGVQPFVKVALEEPGAPASRLVVAGGAGLEAVELVRPAETGAADGARREVWQDEDVGPGVEPVAVVDLQVGEPCLPEGAAESVVVEEGGDARDGDGERRGRPRWPPVGDPACELPLLASREARDLRGGEDE